MQEAPTPKDKPNKPAPIKKPNLDSVTTVNKDGSHYKLHPADVRGKFTFWRRVFGVFLLVIYAGLPWININGHPATFFDVANRKFHLFGLTFVAQDLWLMIFVVTGAGFMLFFVTSMLGRIWCGWTCPYTVFLEHIFRRIERWVEGDASARRRLDAAPWSGSKVFKRVLKQVLFFLSAALISHLFLAYFVSLKELYQWMQGPPTQHLTAFGVVAFLTVALYFCFAWFREQFCIILCPYGRVQSALSDDDTMIIGYDATRGEPRGKAKDANAGDCVDCNRCVQVCPTGIDIRNGLQMECIGCAACVDACNEIMTKLKRPEGLVRYDSYNGLAGKKRRWIRPRIWLYVGLMLIGVTVASIAISSLHSGNAIVKRMKGMPYYVAEDQVRNHFSARLTNKTQEEVVVSFEILEGPDKVRTSGLENSITLPPQGESEHPFVMSVTKEDYTGPTDVELRMHFEPGGFNIDRSFRFLGPDKRLFKSKPKPAADGAK